MQARNVAEKMARCVALSESESGADYEKSTGLITCQLSTVL